MHRYGEGPGEGQLAETDILRIFRGGWNAEPGAAFAREAIEVIAAELSE